MNPQAELIAAEAAKRLAKLRRILNAAGPLAIGPGSRRACDDLKVAVSLLDKLISADAVNKDQV